MAKFNFDSYKVHTDTVSRYVFGGLPGRPWLDCRPATEENRPFFNDLFSKTKSSIRQAQAGGATPDTVEVKREEDRILFSKHIVVNWGSESDGFMPDADGNEVPCTPENVLAYLRAIPNYMFDAFAKWAKDPVSFTAPDSDGLSLPTDEEVKAIEGN